MAAVGLRSTLIYDAVMNPGNLDLKTQKFIEHGDVFEPKKDLQELKDGILDRLHTIGTTEENRLRGIKDIAELDQPFKLSDLDKLQIFVTEPARLKKEILFFRIFEGFTPLMIAYLNGRFDIVEKLEKAGLKLSLEQLKQLLNKIVQIHNAPLDIIKKLGLEVEDKEIEATIKQLKILVNKFGIINIDPELLLIKILERNAHLIPELLNEVKASLSQKRGSIKLSSNATGKVILDPGVISRFSCILSNLNGLAAPIKLPRKIIFLIQETFGENKVIIVDKLDLEKQELIKQEAKEIEEQKHTPIEIHRTIYLAFLDFFASRSDPDGTFGKFILNLIHKEEDIIRHKEEQTLEEQICNKTAKLQEKEQEFVLCKLNNLQFIIAKLIIVAITRDGSPLIALNGFSKLAFQNVPEEQLFKVFRMIISNLQNNVPLVIGIVALLINKGWARFFEMQDKDGKTPVALLNEINAFQKLAQDIPHAIRKSLGERDKDIETISGQLWNAVKPKTNFLLDDDFQKALRPGSANVSSKASETATPPTEVSPTNSTSENSVSKTAEIPAQEVKESVLLQLIEPENAVLEHVENTPIEAISIPAPITENKADKTEQKNSEATEPKLDKPDSSNHVSTKTKRPKNKPPMQFTLGSEQTFGNRKKSAAWDEQPALDPKSDLRAIYGQKLKFVP